MRFFHMSDLHIGKQLHERSLLEDQRYILSQAVCMAYQYKPDAVIIAGDIYDKPVPQAEAVTVFDDFITALKDAVPAVFLISGNHDSAERINFGSRIFSQNNVYFAAMPPRTPDDHIKKVVLKDTFGEVDFWLLPFLKPGYVRRVFEEASEKSGIDSYDTAVRKLLERENIDYSRRNVLVSHQLYTNGAAQPQRCDSEVINIGGLDNIDIGVIQKFDYAALGHIHKAQCIGSENMHYCGTLLKYSAGEENDSKTLTMVELGEKGSPLCLQSIPIKPLRDVKQIKGRFEDIIKQYGKAYGTQMCEDYVSIVLTDENEIFSAGSRLADIFPKLLTIRVQNSRTQADTAYISEYDASLTPLQEFEIFFEKMQGRNMTDEEKEAFGGVLEEVQE